MVRHDPIPQDLRQRPSIAEANGKVPEGGTEEHKPTQAELLVRCAARAELFHTPAGENYATIPVAGHKEIHPVRSKDFRRWVVRRFFEMYDRQPGAQALQDALGLLEARAVRHSRV